MEKICDSFYPRIMDLTWEDLISFQVYQLKFDETGNTTIKA